MGLRKFPYAFTEQGVAMLGADKKLTERMEKVEKSLGKHEGAIRSVFEEIQRLTAPPTGPRRNIGFSGDQRGG
jgi:hypothetical protein